MNAPINERARYWQSVEDYARECIEHAREYDRDLSGVVWEMVDGSEWVIYHARAADVCRFSPNENAVFDCMMTLDRCESMGEVHARAAFFAFRADIYACIDRLGLTVEGGEE
tara:strand:- start:883 stop:1218 length:336 start_codon:yes stop_codon:yes gene_type:complete